MKKMKEKRWEGGEAVKNDNEESVCVCLCVVRSGTVAYFNK